MRLPEDRREAVRAELESLPADPAAELRRLREAELAELERRRRETWGSVWGRLPPALRGWAWNPTVNDGWTNPQG
ncbi:MAG: hypothetical protein GC160_00295 [Acidobacteria bacterium]|nr:hypothetical protein [Acidobacteriota bacterium]